MEAEGNQKVPLLLLLEALVGAVALWVPQVELAQQDKEMMEEITQQVLIMVLAEEGQEQLVRTLVGLRRFLQETVELGYLTIFQGHLLVTLAAVEEAEISAEVVPLTEEVLVLSQWMVKWAVLEQQILEAVEVEAVVALVMEALAAPVLSSSVIAHLV